jgi:lantibiotic modifying enzyme
VANERLFSAVVDDLRESLAPLELLCPRCVPIAADAGFVQWLDDPGATLSESGLRRFHRRLGALIALAYALNATDLHLDNVLAVGEHPVLIDLEMLLYRFPRPLGDSDVTFSGLVEAPSDALPLSGSQGGGDVPTLGMWRRANVLHYRQPVRHLGNRPVDESGTPVAVSAYAGDVLDGFAHAYEATVRRRTSILRLVERFVDRTAPRTRHLLRYTAYYALHLLSMVQPQQRDPVAALRRRLMSDESAADALTGTLVDCEVADLVCGDVPYFFARPNALALEHHSGRRVPGFFARTALDDLGRTLQRLDRDDQRAQEKLLLRSLAPDRVRAVEPAQTSGQRNQGRCCPLADAAHCAAVSR